MLVAGEASDERTKEQHVQTRGVVRETLVDRRQSLTEAHHLQSPAGSSVLSARAPLAGGQTARTSLLASISAATFKSQQGEGSHGKLISLKKAGSTTSRLAWAYYEPRSKLEVEAEGPATYRPYWLLSTGPL